MNKIPSFTVNHLTLRRGIYLSRRDMSPSGDAITTFDIRMTDNLYNYREGQVITDQRLQSCHKPIEAKDQQQQLTQERV